MFFVAALVICLVIKFCFPKGKSIARTIKISIGRFKRLVFNMIIIIHLSIISPTIRKYSNNTIHSKRNNE